MLPPPELAPALLDEALAAPVAGPEAQELCLRPRRRPPDGLCAHAATPAVVLCAQNRVIRDDGRMARIRVGDTVIITEGNFKGERGAVVDKKLFGGKLRVALEKDGKEIKTRKEHVNLHDD